MSRLEGKVAVVSCGASGIGLAIAHRFAKEGARVFIFARRREALDEAVRRIGSGVTAIQADATKLADLDRVGDADRRIVVGIPKFERQCRVIRQRRQGLLDKRAVRDASDRRHSARDLGGVAFGLEAADCERPLGDCIDVAVGAEQRRYQEGAALQALGVAQRRHRHVDARALGAERWQVCRYFPLHWRGIKIFDKTN